MQGNVREKTFHNIFPVPSDIGKEKVLERAKFLNVHFANELRSYEKKRRKSPAGPRERHVKQREIDRQT
jgi:hypothetical protein